MRWARLRRRLMRLIPHDFESDLRGGCTQCTWRYYKHAKGDRGHKWSLS